MNHQAAHSAEAKIAEHRILIVDDDADFAESLQETLENIGYGARVVHTASEAFTITKAFRPQVTLLDIRLDQ